MAPARKHNVDEIVATLRQIERLTDDGMTVSAAAQAHGITDQTFYRWRARYGSLPEDEAKRLQVLDEENSRLKRVIAEQSKDISMLQDLTQGEIISAARRREAVGYLVHRYHISERRACRLVGQHRSTQRYGGAVQGENGFDADPASALSWYGNGAGGTDAAFAGVPSQGWSAIGKEPDRGWEHHAEPDVESATGLDNDPTRPAATVTRLPFLDDHVPCLERLRTSFVHDLAWLARESEVARYVRSRPIVRRLEGLTAAPHELVHLFRGGTEGATA